MKITSHEHPPINCIACGTRLDCASEFRGGDAAPEHGDFTICLACGTPMVFDAALTPRLASQAQLDNLNPEEKKELMMALKIQAAAQLIRRRIAEAIG